MAGLNVHPVRLPDPLAGLGDRVSSVAPASLNLANALASVHHEEEEAALAKAASSAIGEADRRIQEEVLSSRGFGAQGSVARIPEIYQDVVSKYSFGLSSRARRRFDETLAARMQSGTLHAIRHESDQLRGARINANSAVMKSQVDSYTASLNPSNLDEAGKAYTDNFREVNGRVITRESIQQFDKDVNDGDGFIMLPDGRKLRIGKEGETSPDTISMERIKVVRSDMEKQVAHYEKGLSAIYDQAHAQVIEAYLRADRIGEAEHYLSQVGSPEARHPMSSGNLKVAKDMVALHRENADVSSQVGGIMLKLEAEGGRYGSTRQDKLFADFQSRIHSEYSGEKYKLGQKIMESGRVAYRLMREKQAAALADDTVNAMKQVQEGKLNLLQEGQLINNMAESPLKKAMLKAYERKVSALDNTGDPFHEDAQERVLNKFKLDLTKGYADLDGVRYDLSDETKTKAYILNLGLVGKTGDRALQYVRQSRERIDAYKASKVLAELVDNYKDNPSQALDFYPTLLKELEERKGTEPIPEKDMYRWLKVNISEMLMSRVSRDWNFLPDTSGDRRSYIKKGTDPSKLYYTEDQLADTYRSEAAHKAMKAGDIQGAAALKSSTPDKMTLRKFAVDRGYDYRNGYFYLKGK